LVSIKTRGKDTAILRNPTHKYWLFAWTARQVDCLMRG